jgi:hypothetical protein
LSKNYCGEKNIVAVSPRVCEFVPLHYTKAILLPSTLIKRRASCGK